MAHSLHPDNVLTACDNNSASHLCSINSSESTVIITTNTVLASSKVSPSRSSSSGCSEEEVTLATSEPVASLTTKASSVDIKAAVGSSSSSNTSCSSGVVVCLRDTSCAGAIVGSCYKANSEGLQGKDISGVRQGVSCSSHMLQCGSVETNSIPQPTTSTEGIGMDRVTDHSPYSSDEWHSDPDGDHSDSSDDDDPKSQVDRLIERGTLMFMDDENSALSSESESDSDTNCDEGEDSESDITDVSPLISAAASPLGLSPVLPRRTLSTSPLALNPGPLHRQNNLSHRHHSQIEDNHLNQWHNHHSVDVHNTDSTNMALLVKAVMELEKGGRKKRPRHHHQRYHHHHHHNNSLPTPVHQHLLTAPDNTNTTNTNPITITNQQQMIHPIHDSPHHRHLIRRVTPRRKNMSFTNEEVRRIDRDNQILLKKIMAAHGRPKPHQTSVTNVTNNHPTHHHHHHHNTNTNTSITNHNQYQHQISTNHYHNRPQHHQQQQQQQLLNNRPANATINRRREDEKIRRENLILLRKIQDAKPSREVAESRSPRHPRCYPISPTTPTPPTTLRVTIPAQNSITSPTLINPLRQPTLLHAITNGTPTTHGSCSIIARRAAAPTHVNTPTRKETAL